MIDFVFFFFAGLSRNFKKKKIDDGLRSHTFCVVIANYKQFGGGAEEANSSVDREQSWG